VQLHALLHRKLPFTFEDLLPLAEKIKSLQTVCWFHCIFSHDLSFENGSVICLTNDGRKNARKRQREHCNGCLHRMTVSSSRFIGLFRRAKIGLSPPNSPF